MDFRRDNITWDANNQPHSRSDCEGLSWVSLYPEYTYPLNSFPSNTAFATGTCNTLQIGYEDDKATYHDLYQRVQKVRAEYAIKSIERQSIIEQNCFDDYYSTPKSGSWSEQRTLVEYYQASKIQIQITAKNNSVYQTVPVTSKILFNDYFNNGLPTTKQFDGQIINLSAGDPRPWNNQVGNVWVQSMNQGAKHSKHQRQVVAHLCVQPLE